VKQYLVQAKHIHVSSIRLGLVGWPLQDIILLLVVCARINRPFAPPPPALPILLQCYCPIIEQYTTPPPNSRLYPIHHAILVITISCKEHVFSIGARAGGWPLEDIILLLVVCARINRSFILPVRLHFPHCCNTIARLLGNINIRPALDLPFVCHTPYNIGNKHIV